MAATGPIQHRPERARRAPQLLGPIKRWPKTFVLSLLLVTTAVVVPLWLARSDEYRASATLLIENSGGQDPAGERQVATSSELLELRAVAALAARDLGNVSAEEVSDRIEVRAASPADIVRVDATASIPEAAIATANA